MSSTSANERTKVAESLCKRLAAPDLTPVTEKSVETLISDLLRAP